jgi:hypothetical protein
MSSLEHLKFDRLHLHCLFFLHSSFKDDQGAEDLVHGMEICDRFSTLNP